MKDDVFTKAQEDSIRRAFDKIDKDLGLSKYDHKKDTADLKRLMEKAEKARAQARGGGGGGGMFPDTEKVPGKRPLKMKKGGLMKDKEMKDMKKMGRGMAKADMAKKGMKGYKEGGMPMVMKDGKKVPSFAADGKGKMKAGGMAALKKHASMPASKAHAGLKAGGLAAGHKQADGMSKVKTKGTEVKMMNGGMPKTKMMRSGGRGR